MPLDVGPTVWPGRHERPGFKAGKLVRGGQTGAFIQPAAD
jgi:hypothetical protein